ncbi:MAG: tyrosine--tRNA ligase [Candidatus Nitrosopumilus sp. Bin_571-38]
MDITEKVDLIQRSPTEEIVTQDELIELFKTNSSPKHYIGLEISGFLHLGSLISTGFKINDFVKAGVNCTIFLADWHTVINDKLGGDWETIAKVSKYYQDAFKLVCPDAKIVLGSKLYQENTEYWTDLIKFTKHMTLKRTMRTLTIMGRSESDEKIDVARLLYPAMQAVDMHYLDVDIAHSGMDQRKIHMLVREIFPKMKWRVPVAVHHKLLPGLSKPADSNDDKILGKMSKSDPNSGIFIHNTDDEIRKKINKAWCDEGILENNPILAIAESIIFSKFNEMVVERPEKFGGNITYANYIDLENDFKEKKLHPGDLKQTVGNYLVKIVSPIREKLNLSDELSEAIKKSF